MRSWRETDQDILTVRPDLRTTVRIGRFTWPEKRALSIFRKWFGVEIHSLIYDMVEKGIIRKLD